MKKVYVIGNYQDIKRVGRLGEVMTHWYNTVHVTHDHDAQAHWSEYHSLLRDWLCDLLSTTPEDDLTAGERKGLAQAWYYYC